MIKAKRWWWLGMAVAGCLALPAYADYKAAMDALQKKDYATALPLMRESAEAHDRDGMLGMGLIYWNGMGVERNKATALGWVHKSAAAGNPTAMSFLAKVTLLGDGVPKDVLAARSWAEKAAAAGDATGRVLYFMSVQNGPELNVQVNGKLDQALFDRVARRPAEQRTLDTKAYDMLAQAVDQGDVTGKQLAVESLMLMVGPGNMKRTLTLLQGMQPLPRDWQATANIMSGIVGLGETNTSMSVFLTSRSAALGAARAQGEKQGLVKAGVCAPDAITLSRVAVTRPLANGVYLPVTQSLFQKSYLIAGDWQETWTFNACGKPLPIVLEFHADGMGGARAKVAGS